MKPSENYSSEYEDYARVKATYYEGGKFNPVSPWGYRNYLRESTILNLVEKYANQSLLDFGCASGHTTMLLSEIQRISYCMGIDIAPSFIESARQSAIKKNLKNIEFMTLDEYVESESNEYFSVVLCAEVIEHVEDIENLLDTLRLNTTEETVFIITTPNLNGDGSLIGRCLRLLRLRKFSPATNFSATAAEEHGDQHVREFSAKTLERTLTKNGFIVLEKSGMFLLDSTLSNFVFKIAKRIPGYTKFGKNSALKLQNHFPIIYRLFGCQLIFVAKQNQ
jgi:2-polyprenyl-3-methyl-5-hydroxy-6-metoxy-1,4-benzoquinol methylase